MEGLLLPAHGGREPIGQTLLLDKLLWGRVRASIESAWGEVRWYQAGLFSSRLKGEKQVFSGVCTSAEIPHAYANASFRACMLGL